MGLNAQVDIVADWGFPLATPYYGLPIDYSGAISAFCSTFISRSTEAVPVDTGFLRSTLDAYGEGTLMVAEATAEYAEYVEYGTWKMSAQPYFEPAFEEASNAAYEEANKAYDAAMQQEAEMRAQEVASQAQQGISTGNFFLDLLVGIIAGLVKEMIDGIFKILQMKDDGRGHK